MHRVLMGRLGQGTFYGWRVVAAAFVLAVVGWGIGFYGAPIYLHAVHEVRGWPLSVVSTAVTAHFLIGALVVANLPTLYRRFGLPAVTKAGVAALALGTVGWAHRHGAVAAVRRDAAQRRRLGRHGRRRR